MALEFCCGICHESYQATDQIYSTNCGHVFHYHCITDWLKRSSTCSECRASCLSSDLRRIFITSQAQNVTTDELLKRDNAKLKLQLEQAEIDIARLQEILHNKDTHFVDQNIQDWLTGKQKSKQLLEVGSSETYKKLNKSFTEAPTLRQDEVIDSIMLNKDQIKRRGSNQNELQSVNKGQSPKGKKIVQSKPKNRVAGAAPKSPAVNTNNPHESTYCIFQYAQNLRKVGFREIFISKENVYAKKSSANLKIQITSRRQVDELIASSK